ncbi:hypothetical protein [Dyadobacter sp. CY347]|uniref:hypothetical protein n=1 Tax=Dyadobacter sp. CY347 TaxID=2909336 RepID=UPI001F402228|nr:hypothetical protein [Dyadobacter sp. CY347]MCF2487500.1 hypothetical protein [Dyadobacter sp. CY347]
MKIGDIDIQNSILNLEMNVEVLSKVLDYVMQNNPSVRFPTPIEHAQMRSDTLSEIKKKYPSNGILGG